MTKKNPDKTLPTVITMVVDESYSMLPLAASTMSGFNEYVDTVASSLKGPSYFSAITFDTRGIRKLQVGAPLAEAIRLGPTNYCPTGGTPLLDAVMNAIRATDEVVRKEGASKVIVVVQTDGEENSSVECRSVDVLKMAISQRQEKGWEFVFIGAGVNAFLDGQKMGVQAVNTMSYGATPQHTGKMFGAMAQNTVAYARGMSPSMAFTAQQSEDTGESPDILAQKMAASHAMQNTPLDPIDLTRQS